MPSKTYLPSRRAAGAAVALLLSVAAFGPAARPAAAQAPRVRSDGTILDSSGRSFFPYGYFIGTTGTPYDVVKNGISAMAAAGFSSAHVYMASQYWTHRYLPVLDIAASKGMKLFSHPSPFADHVPRHPASLGWMVADDAENFPVSTVRAATSALRAHGPGTLAFAAHSAWIFKPNRNLDLSSYSMASDVTGLQVYPVPKDANNNYNIARGGLHEPFHSISKSVGITSKVGRPTVAILQAFNWRLPGSRPPSGAEAENMTYQSIVAGAKGVLFFTYDNGRSRVRDYPDVWNRTAAITGEIRRLAPVVLNGRRNTFPVGDTIFGSRWTYQNRHYFIAVNASPTATQEISMPLPAGFYGGVSPLFTRRTGRLWRSGSTIRGTLPPMDVQIYASAETAVAAQMTTRARRSSGVVVAEGAGLTGRSARLGVGRHRAGSVSWRNVRDNRISSVRVPSGFEVRLCRDRKATRCSLFGRGLHPTLPPELDGHVSAVTIKRARRAESER